MLVESPGLKPEVRYSNNLKRFFRGSTFCCAPHAVSGRNKFGKSQQFSMDKKKSKQWQCRAEIMVGDNERDEMAVHSFNPKSLHPPLYCSPSNRFRDRDSEMIFSPFYI